MHYYFVQRVLKLETSLLQETLTDMLRQLELEVLNSINLSSTIQNSTLHQVICP